MIKHELNQVYLVGGAVRDSLLGLACKDKDYVVVGETAEAMLKRGFIQVGNDFAVFLHPKSKEEYALARTERKTARGYTGFTACTERSVTLEQDLARRDLTINAMALDKEGRLIDPFNGREDLHNRLLRHTTEAFAEDPVRVLRIARLMARYGEGWRIHPETYDLMLQIRDSGELAGLTPERVWKETEKALEEKFPERYFMTLNGLGIFPEIEAMVGVPQPAEHHPEGDVFTHSMLALKRAADCGFDMPTRFAALTHDFGKALCYRQRGNFWGHEQEGLAVINGFCDRLKVPNRFRRLALLSSDNHTRCHQIFKMSPKKIHKLLVEHMDALARPERFEQFLQACLCDAQGRGSGRVNRAYPQADFARALLANLAGLDRKAVVQTALQQGRKGADIGKALREAEIHCIRLFSALNKTGFIN